MSVVVGPSGDDGPHAFVDDLDEPSLAPDDDHHLRRVQRLRVGGLLTVSDGAGRWRTARLGDDVGSLVAEGPIESVARPEVPVVVAFGLLKGDRNEWVVQKLTELGADRIVPMTTERCVVRWEPAKATRNVERLRRVAREAAMQSRRCWLPTVDEVTAVAAVAAEPGARRADRGGHPVEGPVPGPVLVGPEGGWAPGEADGLPALGLGEHVLRAETASLAAAAVLAQARLAGGSTGTVRLT